VVLTEVLGFGLAVALASVVELPLDLASIGDSVAWTLLTIVCAWLYVTRTLEHGVLALMWAPVVIIVFRPLWAYLAI
jgi:hypothetical protein